MKRIKYAILGLLVLTCSVSQAQTTKVRIPEYIFTEKAIYEVIDDYIKVVKKRNLGLTAIEKLILCTHAHTRAINKV